jgi:prophage regulatory protein
MANTPIENQQTNNRPQLVSLRTAIGLVSASRSSIYRWIHAGTFPAPIRIGERSIAFKYSDLEKWVESRPRVQLNNKEGK